MTVIIIIALLVTMIVPMMGEMRSRAQRANCVNNLRGLYAAASACLDSTQQWPQVAPKLILDDPPEYARRWVAALKPYGLAPTNWVCPTIQSQLGNPDINSRDGARVDYLATPFDVNPILPRKYATQPWFVERGDVHGDGNLVILASGAVKSLSELVNDRH